MSNDKNIFIFYIKIFEKFVKNINEQFLMFERKLIKLYCVNNRFFVIYNILYVFNYEFNFIFFKQLRNVNCSLTFIFINIIIEINDI